MLDLSTTFDTAVALWQMGFLHPADLQYAAWIAMAEGYDTPSLRTLAAYEWSTWQEAGDVLGPALDEMGRARLPLNEAAMKVAAYVAQQIVDNRISPMEGAAQIAECNLATRSGLDALHELSCLAGEYELQMVLGGSSGNPAIDEQVRAAAAHLLQTTRLAP